MQIEHKWQICDLLGWSIWPYVKKQGVRDTAPFFFRKNKHEWTEVACLGRETDFYHACGPSGILHLDVLWERGRVSGI